MVPQVRVKEMSLGHQGLDVRKSSLLRLAQAAPKAFKVQPLELTKEARS